jgi:hypothetical protein
MQSGLSNFISQPKTQGAVAVGSSAVLGGMIINLEASPMFYNPIAAEAPVRLAA